MHVFDSAVVEADRDQPLRCAGHDNAGAAARHPAQQRAKRVDGDHAVTDVELGRLVERGRGRHGPRLQRTGGLLKRLGATASDGRVPVKLTAGHHPGPHARWHPSIRTAKGARADRASTDLAHPTPRLIRPEGGLEDAPAFVTNADGSTVVVMDCGGHRRGRVVLPLRGAEGDQDRACTESREPRARPCHAWHPPSHRDPGCSPRCRRAAQQSIRRAARRPPLCADTPTRRHAAAVTPGPPDRTPGQAVRLRRRPRERGRTAERRSARRESVTDVGHGERRASPDEGLTCAEGPLGVTYP